MLRAGKSVCGQEAPPGADLLKADSGCFSSKPLGAYEGRGPARGLSAWVHRAVLKKSTLNHAWPSKKRKSAAFQASRAENGEKSRKQQKTVKTGVYRGSLVVYTPVYTLYTPGYTSAGPVARTRVLQRGPSGCQNSPYRQQNSRKTDFSESIGEIDRLISVKRKPLITLLSAIQYINQGVSACPYRGVLAQ